MKYNAILAASALLLSSTCNAIYYSLYTDTNCQVLIDSVDITNTTCSVPKGGWSSMQIATAPADGGLSVYSSDDCSATGSTGGTSTLFLGCYAIGFEAHSAELS